MTSNHRFNSRWCMGDSDVNFPILGIHKPVAYCLAIEENGDDLVHDYVGVYIVQIFIFISKIMIVAA